MEKQIEQIAISSLLAHYMNKGNILVEYKKDKEILIIKRKTKKRGIITIKKEMPLKEVIKRFY